MGGRLQAARMGFWQPSASIMEVPRDEVQHPISHRCVMGIE